MALPAMAQQSEPDIFAIWDQFATSNAAAIKCVRPDGDKLARFLQNYQTVSTYAAHRLQEMGPDWTPERIEAAMKERYGQIDKAIAEAVKQETCDGPRLKEVLRRFDAQAAMNLPPPKAANSPPPKPPSR